MERGLIAIAPDGARWRVRRRWSNRPLPRPWRRWLRRDRESADGSGWGAGWTDPLDACSGADDFLAGIALALAAAVVVALLAFVILPLLGIAFELAVALALFGSGILGRVFLGRPWTIEAVNLDRVGETGTFAVKGWRRSRRMILDLAGAIQASGLPAQMPQAAEVERGISGEGAPRL
ncbi:MAG TPA: hypothetical protein VE972_00725 [Conexibacter sp.]|nr:hypothetical protein [Conexibacter sp.]